jgi:hypothetical protein
MHRGHFVNKRNWEKIDPDYLDDRDSIDRIYYNVTLRNENPVGNDSPVPARFEEERVQPLLDNPSDYYLTISRFTVPGALIPIFVFPIQNFREAVSNINSIPLQVTPQIIVNTVAPHGLQNSDRITITGSNSTPSIDGTYTIIHVNSATSFTILFGPPIVGAGTAGVVTRQQDANLSTLSVTIENNGVTRQVFLNYDPRNNLNPPNTPTAQNPEWAKTPYYFVYSYDHMIEMINIALETAFFNIPVRPLGSIAPILCYNRSTQLISWIVQQQFYGGANIMSNQIDVFINTGMNAYLDGVQYDFNGNNTADGKDYRLIVDFSPCQNYTFPCEDIDPQTKTITTIPLGGPGLLTITTAAIHNLFVGDYVRIDGTNSTPSIDGLYIVIGVPSATSFVINLPFAVTGAGTAGTVKEQCPYYQITQEYNTLYLWNSFKDLVFISNSMPIVNEYIKSTTAGLVNFQPIVTDFEPLLAAAGDARSTLQYFPQGPYRLINMNGTIPLKRIDVQVFWKDSEDNLYPILIPKGQPLTIKFLFIKK